MFLFAIVRPWYDSNGYCLFDGKVSMWPIVEYRAAQQQSDNHERGDIITKPLNCDRDKYRELMIEKVILATKEKWPDHE